MSLKKSWDTLLQISTGLTVILALSLAGLTLMLIVALAVLLSKFSVLIR